jgi:hypothetical protein
MPHEPALRRQARGRRALRVRLLLLLLLFMLDISKVGPLVLLHGHGRLELVVLVVLHGGGHLRDRHAVHVVGPNGLRRGVAVCLEVPEIEIKFKKLLFEFF